jgi:alcohol dehydrogenase class IV
VPAQDHHRGRIRQQRRCAGAGVGNHEGACGHRQILHEKTEGVSGAVASLKAAGVAVEVFDDVEPDPMVATARRGAEFARRFAPNGIVGLGGGSPLDIAKVTAAILANEVALEQMWGVGNIPKADVDISEDRIPGLADESFGNQRLLKNNPRSATVQDLTRILKAAAGLTH